MRNALQLGAVNTDRIAAATAEVEKRIWNSAMRSVSAKALSLHATASFAFAFVRQLLVDEAREDEEESMVKKVMGDRW